MAEEKNIQQPQQTEQELSEQRKVRREKLAALQAEGKDPFQQTRFDWDHTSTQIKDIFFSWSVAFRNLLRGGGRSRGGGPSVCVCVCVCV